jgi:hypothetical protein
MIGNKVAPHVARAIGGAQAKPAQPGRPAQKAAAGHVAAGVAAGAKRPAPAPPVQAKPGQKAPAAHVRAALAAPSQKPASSPARPHASAAHLQAKPAPLRQAAPHLAKALSAHRPAAPAAAVQPYVVLGSDKIWKKIPAEGKPYSGYPYVLLGTGVGFVAQQRAPSEDQDESKFLDLDTDDTGATAKIVERTDGRSIRVSDDYNMAIEDSDLRARQPKAIYLADAVLQSSKTKLKQAKSPVKLNATGRKITVIGGWGTWWNVELKEVTPTFEDGSADNLPQNCNEVAGKVAGKNFGKGDTHTFYKMLEVLGKDRKTGVIAEKDLKRYARGGLDDEISRLGLNQHAAPDIGEAFMISSNTNSLELYDQANALAEENPEEAQRLRLASRSDTWMDYFDKRTKRIEWPYHYAAVVAISGSDRITLENYARGDDRKSNPDPRWFFQMYGAKRNQSFHEANRGAFANALTMVRS